MSLAARRLPAGVLAGLALALAWSAAAQAPRQLIVPPAAPTPQPTPAPPPLRAQPLPAPPAASLGLARLGPADPAAGWDRSEPRRLGILLARLPSATATAAVRSFTVQLLAAPWPGVAGETALLLARARALTRLGAGETAAELLLLPEDPASEPERRLEAALALAAAGRSERACLVADPLDASQPLVVALDFVCAVALGDPARAKLVLDLARERGVAPPPAFEPLAEAVLAGEAVAPSVGDGPERPAQLLLLRHVPLQPPQRLDPLVAPDLLATLAANPSLPPEVRLEAGERAAASGWLTAAELRALALDLAPQLAGEPRDGPAGRAAVLRALADETLPAARATLLRRAVALVPAGIERVRWLEMLTPFAAGLPVDDSLLFALDGIGPPLLAGLELERLRAWLARAGQRQEAAASRATASRLAELATLASGSGAIEADGRPPAQRALLFALARGVGVEVPQRGWTALAEEESPGEPVPPPSVALWHIAGDAAAQGRTGEALLAALALLGPAPEAASPLALERALQLLASAGQRPVAGSLAVAIALALRL